MSEVGLTIRLNLKEIYMKLCPKCKRTIRNLVKQKITDEMVSKVLD